MKKLFWLKAKLKTVYLLSKEHKMKLLLPVHVLEDMTCKCWLCAENIPFVPFDSQSGVHDSSLCRKSFETSRKKQVYPALN